MPDARGGVRPQRPIAAEQAVPFGRRLLALDGIRGLAILSVIAFHTLRVSGGGVGFALWRLLQESSWAGVDLFFALSGFLITGILLDSRQCNGYFRNFYIRRALRIMPLYYAVLVVAIFLVPHVLGFSRLPAIYSRLTDNQIWLWTYLQNYLQTKGAHQLPGLGHFWSLAVEEQFYWVWPLVIYFVSSRSLLRICVAVCCLEPVLRLSLLFFGFSPWAVRQYTFTRIDTLLYGAIAAIVFRNTELVTSRRRLILVLVGTAAGVLSAIVVRHGFLPYESPETLVAGYSALGLLFAVIIYLCASTEGRLSALFSNPLLRWFGRCSYAIYIFHWPFAQAYDATVALRFAFLSPLPFAILRFVFVTGVSSAVAWISWTAFESQFLKLKQYFEYRGKAALKIDVLPDVFPSETRRGEETSIRAATGSVLT